MGAWTLDTRSKGVLESQGYQFPNKTAQMLHLLGKEEPFTVLEAGSNSDRTLSLKEDRPPA